MGNEENQKQVSLVSHSPWKSLSRFPHSHSHGDYREEKWKSKSRIPTFPSRLSIVLKNLKRRIPLNAGFPVVQAHRSIRICFLVVGYFEFLKTSEDRLCHIDSRAGVNPGVEACSELNR